MKYLETKSGQLFEFWSNRAEALHDVADIIAGIRYGSKQGIDCDDSLWIQYKDGSHYCIGDDGEYGKFKKTCISCVIDTNACTTMIWGAVTIYNVDDIDEQYSVEIDREDKYWNVDPA